MNNKKIIWHISDTHSIHDQLVIPKSVDIVIHSGDFSNYHATKANKAETIDFLEWYSKLPITYKILISGNHDGFSCNQKQEFQQICSRLGIIYLLDEMIQIEGINIYGTPYTPTFGDWYFMKQRHKISTIYDNIPDNVDILVTHGPPYGILDLATDYANNDEHCGCKALLKQVVNRIKPKMNLFGHIHNNDLNFNQGTLRLNILPETLFSNGSVVKDREMNQLSCNGNILEYEL
jgi:Icc-related predicted phosphoesterase